MSTDSERKNVDPAFLASLQEALEIAVTDSGPPTDVSSANELAGSVWISIEERLPMPLLVVQVWNSAWGVIEDAYYDLDIKQWQSNDNGFPYLFGAVTHWRSGS